MRHFMALRIASTARFARNFYPVTSSAVILDVLAGSPFNATNSSQLAEQRAVTALAISDLGNMLSSRSARRGIE